MIKRYYHSHKDLTLFLVSVFLILVGWGVSVVTFVMFKGKEGKSSLGSAPISLVIRVVYGLVSTISTNYYLDREHTQRYSISSFLDRYSYYILFSVVTIVSGWFITIQTLLSLGYIPSVMFRLIFGVLCTFVTLRFIPKKTPRSPSTHHFSLESLFNCPSPRQSRKPRGAIVILGHRLNPDGSISSTLQSRLDTAIHRWKKDGRPLVICSGGQTTEGEGANRSEAKAMLQYLKKKEPRIASSCVLEENSQNTVGNAVESVHILKKHNIKKVVLVTSDYHLPRASYIFEAVCNTYRLENVTIIPVSAPGPSRGSLIKSLLREKRIMSSRVDSMLDWHNPRPAIVIHPLPEKRLKHTLSQIDLLLTTRTDNTRKDSYVSMWNDTINSRLTHKLVKSGDPPHIAHVASKYLS